MALVGSRELARQLRQRQMVTMEGFTCLRIGAAEMPLGVIVLRPPLEDESGTEALAASHAAAIMAAELHSERADRTLHTYARPATLLALAHGLIDARRPLTRRERETLHHLLVGRVEKQVAAAMGLSERTLHHHVTALYQKFGVQSRAELMALFLRSTPRPELCSARVAPLSLISGPVVAKGVSAER